MPAKPLIPGDHDIALATQSSKELARLFPKKKKDFQMLVLGDKLQAKITFPFPAIKLLLEILTIMAEGNAITIYPVHAELTTQEAANLLNVSRPFLIKLLDKGFIPFHKVGTHRRVRFSDLMDYKKISDEKSNHALNELLKQAQELNLGYEA